MTDSLETSESEAVELTPSEATSQQADAWFSVCNLLDELSPGWSEGNGTGVEKAVATIRAFADTARTFLEITEGLEPNHDILTGTDAIACRKELNAMRAKAHTLFSTTD